MVAYAVDYLIERLVMLPDMLTPFFLRFDPTGDDNIILFGNNEKPTSWFGERFDGGARGAQVFCSNALNGKR